MDHVIREVAHLTVLALSGDLDMTTSAEMSKLILSHLDAQQHLAMDLSDVSYIDSSGIACLVEGHQKAQADGRIFGLVAVSESALRVLQLARLDQVFAIYPSAEKMAES